MIVSLVGMGFKTIVREGNQLAKLPLSFGKHGTWRKANSKMGLEGYGCQLLEPGQATFRRRGQIATISEK